MKAKKIVLDVDFIGGESPLTVAEEKALSDFFRQKKLVSRAKKIVKKSKKMKRELVTA